MRIENIFKILAKRPVYHFLLWATYALLVAIFNIYYNELSLIDTCKNLLIHLFFLSIVVYYNLRFLIPRFLQRKKILLYFFSIIALAFIISPIEIVVTYFIFSSEFIFENFQENIVRMQTQKLIFINTVVTLLYIVKSWYIQDRIRRDLEHKNLVSELSFLRSQINPHFLFNTLNSLYALSLRKSDDTPQLILKLSQIMRYMLYECNEKYVSLQKELNYIENYLALEKLRFGQKVNIVFDHDIDAIENYEIAPLLFITFLENSFKHGVSHQLEKGGEIVIYLSVENNILEFNISNQKHNIPKSANYSGGIGLENIQKRLALLYPNAYELDILEEEEMYHIQLRLELNKHI